MFKCGRRMWSSNVVVKCGRLMWSSNVVKSNHKTLKQETGQVQYKVFFTSLNRLNRLNILNCYFNWNVTKCNQNSKVAKTGILLKLDYNQNFNVTKTGMSLKVDVTGM